MIYYASIQLEIYCFNYNLSGPSLVTGAAALAAEVTVASGCCFLRDTTNTICRRLFGAGSIVNGKITALPVF